MWWYMCLLRWLFHNFKFSSTVTDLHIINSLPSDAANIPTILLSEIKTPSLKISLKQCWEPILRESYTLHNNRHRIYSNNPIPYKPIVCTHIPGVQYYKPTILHSFRPGHNSCSMVQLWNPSTIQYDIPTHVHYSNTHNNEIYHTVFKSEVLLPTILQLQIQLIILSYN